MDMKLFLKLLDIMAKYNIHSLPVELNTLGDNLRKVNHSFIANVRYQPLSSRSKFGRIKIIVTKLTPIKTASTTDLSHVFSKVSNDGSACPKTRTEKVYSNRATNIRHLCPGKRLNQYT